MSFETVMDDMGIPVEPAVLPPTTPVMHIISMYNLMGWPTPIDADGNMFSKQDTALNRGVLYLRRDDVPCPTCKKRGDESCVRGRWPSAVWKMQVPFPEGHDSRRTVNK